jgi:anti-sigma28 factor (negative regulator of flagellin synthesis)
MLARVTHAAKHVARSCGPRACPAAVIPSPRGAKHLEGYSALGARATHPTAPAFSRRPVTSPALFEHKKRSTRDRKYTGINALSGAMSALAISQASSEDKEDDDKKSEIKTSRTEELKTAILDGEYYACTNKKESVEKGEKLLAIMRSYTDKEISEVYKWFDALIHLQPEKINPDVFCKLILFDPKGEFLLQSLSAKRNKFKYEAWEDWRALLMLLLEDRMVAKEYQDTVILDPKDVSFLSRADRLLLFIKILHGQEFHKF